MRLLLVMTALAIAAPAAAESLLAGGTLTYDLRARFEAVDQASKPRRARAQTVRARLGYEIGPWHGFSAKLEGEAILALGGVRYDDGIARRPEFPVVRDAQTLELNQYWLAYAPRPETEVTLGRQAINHGARTFVGTAKFRQNQNTYDAVTAVDSSLPDIRLEYAMVWLIDTTSGEDAVAGDWNTRSHLFHASYEGLADTKLGVYALLLDFDERPRLSTRTLGLRIDRDWGLGEGLAARVAGELAWQTDHGNNPAEISEHLVIGEAGLAFAGLHPLLGVRLQTGDGRNALQAPLGIKHGNRGWADIFSTVPADGLLDIYAQARLTLGEAEWLAPATSILGSLQLYVTHHRFYDDGGGRRYGREVDVGLRLSPLDGLELAIEYADYRAAGFAADTRKFWLSLTIRG